MVVELTAAGVVTAMTDEVADTFVIDQGRPWRGDDV